jgi:hypothetical protein
MQGGGPLQAQNPFRSPRDPIRLPLAIPAFKIAKHHIYAKMFRVVLVDLFGAILTASSPYNSDTRRAIAH